jgi:hypothetical protein
MPFLGKIDAKEEKRGVLGKKMFPTRQLFFPNWKPLFRELFGFRGIFAIFSL